MRQCACDMSGVKLQMPGRKDPAKRHLRSQERYNSHTSQLEPLAVGDIVAIQNQRGNAPKRWQNTGTIVSTNIPARQYEVKIDGSRRVTRRNRRFLRKIDPVCCKPSYISKTHLQPSYTPNGNNTIPPIQQNQSECKNRCPISSFIVAACQPNYP